MQKVANRGIIGYVGTPVKSEMTKNYIVETNNTFSGETAILSAYKDPDKAVKHADTVDLICGTWVVVSEWTGEPNPARVGTYYRRNF